MVDLVGGASTRLFPNNQYLETGKQFGFGEEMVSKQAKGKQITKAVKKALGNRVIVRKNAPRKVKRASNYRPTTQKAPVFGPVSTIDTAPVSIGNSISGTSPVIIPVHDGVRVQGRDYLCDIYAVKSTLTNWTLAGACPLVPHCLVSSILKSYAGIYSYYVVNGMAFHYITASPTSEQGDVMLYISKSRGDPGINNESTNFMSVVLSDHNTTIGPLWKNHTAAFFPTPKLYPSDIFNDEDLMHQGPGELFVFTKTTSALAPGFILIDYDITFSVMQVNIRALTFPVSRMKYTQIGLSLTTAVWTINSTIVLGVFTGLLLDGATSGAAPTGATVGDIYKIVMCESAATYTNVNSTNWAVYGTHSTTDTWTAITLQDGFTVYGVIYTTGAMTLYPSYAAAVAQYMPLRAGISATVTYNIPSFISLVGSVGSVTQSNI